MTLYILPVSFVESPQRHDGRTERLAGTMLWFAQVEWIQDGTRRLIDTAAVPAAIDALSADEKNRAAAIWRSSS